ncbi:MAG TPA: CBS domain-containing protein [Thermoanaerobaculia bacterium]|nr:CBS domain-containing protein [Thermoanaerobaculia bacterium]
MTATQARGSTGDPSNHVFHFFSELLNRRVRTEDGKKLGKVSDLVFRLTEPFPEAVGIYMRHAWGKKPAQLVPWEMVVRIDPDAVIVKLPPSGDVPLFVDQKGWIMLEEHLMGRTILEIDGRKTEVVNDVHLLEAKGKLLLVHVDGSLNGILRRWSLSGLSWQADDLISWKFVQPFSVEDAVASDEVMLSVTREQLKELPGEDLADALEELPAEEQKALFSALDSEKAAETLVEAEPRAQRQLVANLRKERARAIFSEMSIAQVADIFSILPHDHQEEFLEILPNERAARIRTILSKRELTAGALMSADFLSIPASKTVSEALAIIRSARHRGRAPSYLYVSNDRGALIGVVDLRELISAPETASVAEIMASPVVMVGTDDVLDDVVELFARYHFRMLPVVDPEDHVVGVVHSNDMRRIA